MSKKDIKSKQLKQIEESFKKASEAMASFGMSFKEFMHANKELNKEQPPEFEYPMFFESIHWGFIYKFTSINDVEVITVRGGCTSVKPGAVINKVIPHTDSEAWKQIPHDKETGFYDKQPILCKNEGDVSLHIRAWDNVNRRAFDWDGCRKSGATCDYYYALEVVQKEMQPYFDNLED